MKRVFLVHGWDGHPEENWFPWLKKQLEAKGLEVHVPQLPKSDNPEIHSWVATLAEAVGSVDDQTLFVGHSMGCQAIVRFLETLPIGIVASGAVFVAGFFKRLTNLEKDEQTQSTTKVWLTAPIDFKKVGYHLRSSIAIFSDNDPYVPLDNQDDFRDKLGSAIVIEHNQGHFNAAASVTELPAALQAVLKLVGE